MAAHRFVAVVGARVLPEAAAPQVAAVVRFFVDRAGGASGRAARGARTRSRSRRWWPRGRTACARSVVFLPGAVPAQRGGARRLRGAGRACGARRRAPGGWRCSRARGGWRGRRPGVVAFLWGPSRGSVFTVREAIRAGKPAAVVLAGGGAVLPAFAGAGGCRARFGRRRGVPVGHGRRAPRASAELSARRCVASSSCRTGEPTHALLAHIAVAQRGRAAVVRARRRSPATRCWSPHEALSDTPAFLTVPRLMRRFRCTAREAGGPRRAVPGARRGPGRGRPLRGRGAAAWASRAIIEDLVHLVARLALGRGGARDRCARGRRAPRRRRRAVSRRRARCPGRCAA